MSYVFSWREIDVTVKQDLLSPPTDMSTYVHEFLYSQFG